MFMRVLRSRRVALLLAIVWLVSPSVTPAFAATAQPLANNIYQPIEIAADQTIRLAKSAPAAPSAYGSFRRFGIYTAPTLAFSTPFTQVQVQYQHSTPDGSVVRVDVRALSAEDRWTEWQTDVAHSTFVSFDERMQAVQYRVVLMSNSAQSPAVRAVALEPRLGSMTAKARNTTVAPTYRLRVTRQGLVGGRTANGHIIKPNDFFVSLPSDRVLSSRGGDEYMVRLSANGRSIVVPVWDNGPWNHNDDFWNKDRERYKDLPVGWPQDHAAYYENHNRGVAERGRVRYPSAVDIADGAYWALGLNGAQATVNVSFLWLGADPGADAQPLNTKPSERPKAVAAESQPLEETSEPPAPAATPAPAVAPAPAAHAQAPVLPLMEVDDTDKAFTLEGSNSTLATHGCAFKGQARTVRTVSRDDSVTHQALWRPTLQAGAYDVYAFVPACATGTATSFARYIVHHAQGDAFVVRNQAHAAGTWVSLGRFTFAAGSDGYVQLRNLGTADEAAIWFDAVRWVPVTH